MREQIGQALNNFLSNTLAAKILTYGIYGVVLAGLFLAGYFAYIFLQYKYKIWTPKLIWESDGKTFKVWKWQKDVARPIKQDGRVTKWHLLKRNKYIEKIPEKHILPGNVINLFCINDDGTYKVLPKLYADENVQFEYIDNETSRWAMQELKESQQANQSEEATKRIFNYVIIAVVIISAMLLIATYIWMTNLSGLGKDITGAVNGLKGTLQNVKDIPN